MAISSCEDVYDIDATGAVIALSDHDFQRDQCICCVRYRVPGAGGDISATVGGINSPVLLRGSQGVQTGLDQFNILIPPELAAGGPQVVSIVLTAAGQPANSVAVAVK